MIKYDTGTYGLVVLFRFHGSALFRSVFPAFISSVIYVILTYTTDIAVMDGQLLTHPYPMGALISALTFMLAFRATFAYNRWWEAFTTVYGMQSKWLDVGLSLAAFHLQARKFEGRKPPAFGEHPEVDFVARERVRAKELTLEELEARLSRYEKPSKLSKALSHLSFRKVGNGDSRSKTAEPIHTRKTGANLIGKKSITGNSGNVSTSNAVIMSRKTKGIWSSGSEPLFLEEAAHLLSLLSAVAFSTLRNDLEYADSPLITFDPREPFPHVDPDAFKADVRKEWADSTHRSVVVLRYLFGISRSPAMRTKYNAARPFRVIGGVSDSEIALLQAARGPLAKVSLVSMWLQEFLSREHLAGSMGDIAPLIISRLFQHASDGMTGYNQARKIAYIPFPFVHAQVTSFFVLVVVGFMPVLMLSFINNLVFGFFMNLLTVMCFTGLHEVARELESPFQNVPNDVPVNNFQSQFNHALMTMFSGYHPDAYWEFKPKNAVYSGAPEEEEDNSMVMTTVTC